MRRFGFGLHIAAASIGVSAIALAIVAVGVQRVGGSEFEQLMIQHGASVAAARGRVLSRQQLQDALYEEGVGPALDRTIDVHIGRLRAKLGDDPKRPRYVATVRGGGYRAGEQ